MSSSSSYIDATAGAVEHCQAMAQAHPDLAEHYYTPITSYLQDKLWHQLTVRVLEFLHDPKAARTNGVHLYLALYDQVVVRVDAKLDALALARMAALVASALYPSDPVAAKAVLENLLVNKQELMETSPSAKIYCESKLSLLTLQNYSTDTSTANKQALDAILPTIRTNAALLHQVSSLEPVVHAAHYQQAMNYYKVVGPPEAFYEQAMAYLRYATEDDVDAQLAVDLSLAALTGDGVYNLQQVLEHETLWKQLPASQQWLQQLVQACADGNVVQFQQLSQQYATQIQAQPALVHRAAQVQEKLSLLALVHTAFEKDAHERTLTLTELSTALHVPLDQVELLVMRALSVGLIQGSMDQVDGTVQVTWVMPRSLQTQQLEALAARYGEWATKVETTNQQTLTPAFA